VTDDHVVRNRAAWDRFAEEFVEPGRRSWASDEPTWGTWGVPEDKVGMLIDVDGLDTIELGCGTGYVSAWLARGGGLGRWDWTTRECSWQPPVSSRRS